MNSLLSLLKAGGKPVVGMVQLDALPGGSRYRDTTIDDVLGSALMEAGILADNGVDALMVQNLGDIPVNSQATSVQVAWMTRVTSEIRRRCGIPVGLNLLENDAEAMMAVASASGADFVRIKIYVGAMVTPFGVETAQAFAAIRARYPDAAITLLTTSPFVELARACPWFDAVVVDGRPRPWDLAGLLRLRRAWRADHVAIFADVHDRTGNALVAGTLQDDLDAAVRLGSADGLVLTGKTYAQTHELVATARRVVGAVPILIGGGVTVDNISEVQAVADGTIVSSSLKSDGTAFGQFDPGKVQAFVAAARAARPRR